MILGDFYLILMQRLKDKVPAIKHIDWFNDQFSQEDEEYQFPKPAVLIEFPPAEVITLGNRKQAWNQNFILHIGSTTVNETSSATKQAVRENTLKKHLNMLDDIHFNLQNYNGTDQGVQFGSIQQQGSPVSHSYDLVIVHTMNFLVRLENTAAMRKLTHIAAPLPAPNITVTEI